MECDKLIHLATELQSLAQAGLYYGKDVYDRERYTRIREIAAEMITLRSDLPYEKVTEVFCADSGYQTPKVDTRAAIFSGDRILLVREKDGRWALPGGWCEFDLAPAANTVKEVREEAGREVKVTSLIAVQNRNDHNTPPYAYGVVKLFYLCEELGGEFRENSETTTADYFAADDLPPLAEEKCNADQVLMCFRAHNDPAMRTVFD